MQQSSIVGRSCSHSQQVVSNIIGEILVRTSKQIHNREVVQKHLKSFASVGLLSLLTQTTDQLKSSPVKKLQKQKIENHQSMNSAIQQVEVFDQDCQANIIQPDSLMMLETIEYQDKNKEQKQESKNETIGMKTNKGKSSRINSQRNCTPSISTIQKPTFEKLDVMQEQIDKILNAMREETMRKQHKKQQQVDHAEKQKKSKEEVNYDYSGNIIPLKIEKKRNLINQQISGTTGQAKNKQENKVITVKSHEKKQLQGEIVVTKKVQFTGEKKKLGKNNKALDSSKLTKSREPTIQFSNITDPYNQINVKSGVKVVVGKNVIQKIEREPTVEDIKNNLTNRKLSKNQYSRIRENQPVPISTIQNLDRNQPILGISDKKAKVLDITPIIHKPRSALKKRSTTQNGEKVHIMKPGMKQLLSNPVSIQEKQFKQQSKDNPKVNSKKKEELNRIDKYNIEYTRNYGQQMSKEESVQHIKNQEEKYIQFPKILQHKSESLSGNSFKTTLYKKNRQRVRVPTAQLKERRKKFEEKLRP